MTDLTAPHAASIWSLNLAPANLQRAELMFRREYHALKMKSTSTELARGPTCFERRHVVRRLPMRCTAHTIILCVLAALDPLGR